MRHCAPNGRAVPSRPMGEFEPEAFLDEALRKLMLQGLVAGLPNYVALVDRDRRVLFLNRTLSRDVSEVVGQPMDRFIAASHREAAVSAVERAFSSGERQVISYDSLVADGSLLHMKAHVVPLQEPSGRSVALLIITDETERRKLEAELQRSEEFRRRIIEHLPDYVSLLDREHRFIWVNRLAPGLEPADVVGTKIEAFLAPDSVAPTFAAIEATFTTGVAGQCETQGYRDGISTRWVLNRTVPVEVDGKVDAVLLITSDLSELKRAEHALREKDRQLHHAQHLESIGQLAGGIAHDFNNLLQVIDGNLHFIQDGLAYGQDVSEDLDQALRATRSAAELTSRLLAVGRRKRVATARVDLAALAAVNMRMLRAAIPENVNIVFEPPAEACFVQADAAEFEQVLINLCVNARDAMPNGGTLRVWVEPEGSEHVLLNVADDGIGIPKADLTRVFEPFFSTKSKGSGLGLAVAAGIIAAHGGTIVAESDGVRGTTLRVRLPRTEGERISSRPAPEPLLGGGSATILVAEDEPRVRAQVVRILQGAGYTVIEAENGLRAIELFKAKADEIDLLVLDAIMPQCDGWRAYVEIERTMPGVKALFTTGYAANVLPSDFSARGARLLSKPFKPAELLAKVKEMLEPAAIRR
jgi:two-component system cell cycle sensor histidine kinase/response regulator CckA